MAPTTLLVGVEESSSDNETDDVRKTGKKDRNLFFHYTFFCG